MTLAIDQRQAKDARAARPGIGLTTQEAEARRAAGQGNNVRVQTSRTAAQILRENVFTLVNAMLFSVMVALLAVNRTGDAVATSAIVLINVVLGVIQEIRAKAALDKIALLTRPKATVIRDGVEDVFDPSEIVLGDALVVGSGDQIVVDGQIIDDGVIHVDESLLTGESDLVPKRHGDKVLSGSFVVTGNATYVAEKVGANSFANQITHGAKAYRRVRTPLQREINIVLRVVILLALQLALLLFLSFAIEGVPFVEGVQATAVVVSLIPQGLLLMVTVAYAMGALKIARRGALVQQANAVESLSNVDVLCLDKTGTLTSNKILLFDMLSIGQDDITLRRWLGIFTSSTPRANRTADAILAAIKAEKLPLREHVVFSSDRKWSAASFDHDGMRGTFVLGAPEMIAPALAETLGHDITIDGWTHSGLRVLLFAYHPEVLDLYNGDLPILPSPLQPAGLIAFSDELRAEAAETLAAFANTGVQLKLISGDNPQTVAALAQQAGLSQTGLVVSGLALADMDDTAFTQAVLQNNVFGRITPEQKQRIVQVLKTNGHYVAMIGDGVNDVLSLKQAHLGIAMESGSHATRSVADIVLLGDSFAVLPKTFQEGQRILNGMQDIARLFLTRTFYVTLLVIVTQFIGTQFPLVPKHNSLLATLPVGIPTIFLALWARPGPPSRGLLASISRFVLPAGFTIAISGLLMYLVYLPEGVFMARTALTTTALLSGLVLLIFVEPPTHWLAVGDNYSGDLRPTLLAGAMLLVYLAIFQIEPLRIFFELYPLQLTDWLVISGAVLVWASALWVVWRRELFDKLFDPNIG